MDNYLYEKKIKLTTSFSSAHWFKPGAFSLLNRIAVVLFGFANIFMLVRLLPPSVIGVWVLFTSIGGILETLRNGFIRNPFITRLVVSKTDDQESIIQSSLYLHILIASGIAILIVALARPLAQFWEAYELEKLFYIYALNTLILIIYLHFEYLLQSKLIFKGIFFSTITRLSLVFLFLVFHFISDLKPSLYSLAIVQVFSTLIASFVSYQFVKLYFPFTNWKPPHVASIKDLFHFGKYTFGTNISSMLIKSTDSLMIGKLISSTGVALYNPAIRIANIVEVPTLALASVVFPQVGNKMKESGIQGIQDIYYKSVSLILTVMLPVIVPVYFLADYIILILFGEAYIDAAPILKVTVFYTLIIPFNRQFGTVMDALNMPKLNFYLLLAVAILNIILNYILLAQLGVIGAAYATLLSYLAVFAANQLILYHKFKINTTQVFIEVLHWYRTFWSYFMVRIFR